MQRYILERVIQHTERAEVIVDNWDEAVKAFEDAGTDFKNVGCETSFAKSLEFTGDE